MPPHHPSFASCYCTLILSRPCISSHSPSIYNTYPTVPRCNQVPLRRISRRRILNPNRSIPGVISHNRPIRRITQRCRHVRRIILSLVSPPTIQQTSPLRFPSPPYLKRRIKRPQLPIHIPLQPKYPYQIIILFGEIVHQFCHRICEKAV